MRLWRFKVKFKPMNGGNNNKTNTDRKAVPFQAMTHIQCCMSGWRIIGALNLPRASSRQLAYNVIRLCACCVKTNQNINLNTKKHRL